MAQKHDISIIEQPMTVATTEQGPQKRYRRLRFPSFNADVWAEKNPLLQKGELGHEKDTGRFKVGDGITYWLDLPYNSVGESAKINGYNVLELVAGKNVLFDQQDNVFTISAKGVEYTAGDGISIEGNVISNTRTNAEWGNITGDLNNQTDLQDALGAKQDKLTAGANIRIEDNVISSTAQESFFRGRWDNWEEVPNDANSYPEDFNGNRTPTMNDYMVVVDASQYTPGMTESIIISKKPNSHILVINGVNVGNPNQTRTYTFDTVTYTVESIDGGGSIKVFANKNVQYNGQLKIVGTPVILTAYASTLETSKIYYSKLDNLSGTWRFGYKGVWADDNESGWKPEYQIEDTLPVATETQAGINKLYTAGANINISDDNVISSTAQESFFRGRYAEWNAVPTNGSAYPNDINGNHTPSNTDYIIIEDASTVPGGQVDVQMTMETDIYSSYPTGKLETVINGITYSGTGTFDDGNIEVFCNTDAGNYTAHWKTLKNNVEYQGVTYEAGSVFFKVVIRPEKNTTQNAKLSLGNPYTGSWRFSYRGAWDLDNKNGWKAEYQIEEIMPIADETQMGIAKLYTATGSNTDGTMTQKAITENTTRVIIRRWE